MAGRKSASKIVEIPYRSVIPREKLLEVALQGCDWLTDVGQVTEKDNPDFGAIRGEYNTKVREWSFYGPFWHTGQAVRALLMAFKMAGNGKYLKHAIWGGEYMIRPQVLDEKDTDYYGCITSSGNMASQLEGLRVLHDLYLVTGEKQWRERFKLAVDWVIKTTYLKGEGLFLNEVNIHYPKKYELGKRERARPLNDDATLYAAYQEFKESNYLKTFLEVADRLLQDEDPPGNWIKYYPCDPNAFGGLGHIHPRHAWWWGYPMLSAYDATGGKKYLECGIRSGDWYIQNSTLDGAIYYHTTRNSKHLSFDFCTSAVGCAIIMWIDLWKKLKDEKYREAIGRGLGFLLGAQLGQDVEDRNLRGVFFERLNPTDGTEEPGFHVRDIATIFAAQAILKLLEASEDKEFYYFGYPRKF